MVEFRVERTDNNVAGVQQFDRAEAPAVLALRGRQCTMRLVVHRDLLYSTTLIVVVSSVHPATFQLVSILMYSIYILQKEMVPHMRQITCRVDTAGGTLVRICHCVSTLYRYRFPALLPRWAQI